MQALQRGKVSIGGALRSVAVLGAVLGLTFAAMLGGCGSTIQTPLPDVKPVSSASMSQEERKKAVDELNRKRATHEQDAEQQIEQSR